MGNNKSSGLKRFGRLSGGLLTEVAITEFQGIRWKASVLRKVHLASGHELQTKKTPLCKQGIFHGTSMGNPAPEIGAYVDLGFKDYVAARALLLNEMLLQGAGLVGSAVEKYTKSYAIARGKPLKKNHIGEDFITDLKAGAGLPPHVSENFLRSLGKCYSLRYLDKIPAGFNLCIRQRQLLAELDETILGYERAFSQTRDGARVPTQCQTAVQDKDPRVATRNWIMDGVSKTNFIAQRDAVYETRFFGPLNWMEVTYYTEEGKNDGDFLKAAFVEESPTKFQLAFLPLP